MTVVKPRGWCPVCERDIQLKVNGTLRHHGGPVGSGHFSDYRSYHCKGAGKFPGVNPLQPSAATQTAAHARKAVVDDFLAEEATFVTAMETCPEDKADHHFAMGHAQARRHLAERLALIDEIAPTVTDPTKRGRPPAWAPRSGLTSGRDNLFCVPSIQPDGD